MIEKNNIMIGPTMGASPNTDGTKLQSGIVYGGRSQMDQFQCKPTGTLTMRKRMLYGRLFYEAYKGGN